MTPRVDGRIDDASWPDVPWSGGFVQRLSFRRGLGQTFDVPAHDVFLVKFSKWFAL